MIFLDWDEIVHLSDELKLNQWLKKQQVYSKGIDLRSNIHTYLEGGFSGKTRIELINGTSKEIKSLEIGDILLGGEKVLGLVEIDGNTMDYQCIYTLYQDSLEKEGEIGWEGGPNHIVMKKKDNSFSTLELPWNEKVITTNYRGEYIWIEKRKKPEKEKESILYQIITDKQVFRIKGIDLNHYNGTIDFLLG
jgi:hypothetical protein